MELCAPRLGRYNKNKELFLLFYSRSLYTMTRTAARMLLPLLFPLGHLGQVVLLLLLPAEVLTRRQRQVTAGPQLVQVPVQGVAVQVEFEKANIETRFSRIRVRVTG